MECGVDASLSSDDEGRGSVPVREYDEKGKPGTGTRMDYNKNRPELLYKK